MARKTAKPGRILVVFFVGVAILYGLAALGGTWKPALGLDLEGGTRITLSATGQYDSSDLETARQIIESRVNGSGVTEAQVTTQSGKYVIVEVPGPTTSGLVATVTRQAQLRFRLVACSDAAPGPCATSTSTSSASASTGPTTTPGVPTAAPGVGVTVAPSSPKPSAKSTATPEATSKPTATSNGASVAPRVAPAYAVKKPKATPSALPTIKATSKPSAKASPTAKPTASASSKPSSSASAKPSSSAGPSSSPTTTTSGSPSASPSAAPTVPPQTTGGAGVADVLTWQTAPDAASIKAYNDFSCPTDGKPVDVPLDDPTKPLVTCGTGQFAGEKFLLSAAAVEGSEITKATSGIQQGQVQYSVDLNLNSEGRKSFANISGALAGGSQLFAIVLDGQVISAASFTSAIPNGQANITGGFTQASAASLATSLKYGALPIKFEDSMVETVGPSLAGDQLSAGITAGIVGLILVMLYCLLYYRGLGVVVVSSLIVAGGVTYALVLILSKSANFSLSLPGIAGLIVAVGITADSFIVLFERVRDEMRDGKSMRVAVEAGWDRAKRTCLAADTVSLLASVILYIFAAGVVKGFAFTLGLSTLIDLGVFFWFTKPFVSTLARYRFFNSGHRLSGLSAETLGVDRIVGGRA